MELLKLVIVDDEPILLKGLLTTYDWKQMGFQVVGTAQSGEQAIQVIEETRPDAVLTDIRMKQMTGLDVMEQVRQTRKDCLFIVLSAYRDFDYAQKACDLGAFAYLLKPIEDDKLLETMSSAYESCMKQRRSAEKVANLEKVIQGDSDSFLQMVVQKYLQKEISAEKMQQVLEATGQMIGRDDRFVTLMAGVDLAYKITNALEYEASCFVLKKELQERMEGVYDCWNFVMQKDGIVFVIRTTENTTVHKLKQLLDQVREEQNSPVIGAISKPYKGLDGIRRSYEEAKQLLELAASSKAGILTTLELAGERAERSSSAEEEAVFAKAGIGTFPTTWDGFWKDLELLEQSGITPLALHTEGTGWAPMLIATAATAQTPEGEEFLREMLPHSYDTPAGYTLVQTLQKLFAYTTEDALHEDYDVAYSNFFSGKAAMLPNGYWLIGQIPDGWEDKVRFAAFPEGTLVASPETFGWAIVADYDEEVQEGAMEFLKFRTRYNWQEKQTLFAESSAEAGSVLADYLQAFTDAEKIIPNYQTKWNSVLQEETIGKGLPLLAEGEISIEEFLEMMEESILEYQAEQ